MVFLFTTRYKELVDVDVNDRVEMKLVAGRDV